MIIYSLDHLLNCIVILIAVHSQEVIGQPCFLVIGDRTTVHAADRGHITFIFVGIRWLIAILRQHFTLAGDHARELLRTLMYSVRLWLLIPTHRCRFEYVVVQAALHLLASRIIVELGQRCPWTCNRILVILDALGVQYTILGDISEIHFLQD